MDDIKPILLKFKRTPGLCSPYELQRVEIFFAQFKYLLEIYAEVAYNPFGATIDAELTTVQWYLDNPKRQP